MAKLLDDSISASHRLHLRALVRQERGVDYQRQDYLSPDFQKNLLRRRNEEEEREALENEGAEASSPQTNDKANKTQQRESPTSITSSTSSVDFDTSVVSSLELCIQWRTRIVEWKYQVVDRFGTRDTIPPLLFMQKIVSFLFALLISVFTRFLLCNDRSQP